MLPQALTHFATADPIFHAATRNLEPIDLSRPHDTYLALMRAVTGQQLSVKAAANIWSRVVDKFGETPDPQDILDTHVEDLRALGLSYRKAGYMHNVCREAIAGRINREDLEKLDDEAIIEHLTAIKGIGRWTVEMILMFSFRRPDIMSVGDLGVRQAVAAIHELEETGKDLERRVDEISQAWSPYRSYACRLLWAWKRENPEIYTRRQP